MKTIVRLNGEKIKNVIVDKQEMELLADGFILIETEYSWVNVYRQGETLAILMPDYDDKYIDMVNTIQKLENAIHVTRMEYELIYYPLDEIVEILENDKLYKRANIACDAPIWAIVDIMKHF